MGQRGPISVLVFYVVFSWNPNRSTILSLDVDEVGLSLLKLIDLDIHVYVMARMQRASSLLLQFLLLFSLSFWYFIKDVDGLLQALSTSHLKINLVVDDLLRIGHPVQ